MSLDVSGKLGEAHSVITNNFWDYLTYSWSAATGRSLKPSSNHLQKVVRNDEDFMYDIGDALESAMQDIHKPIVRDKEARIILARPRIGDLLELNKRTLDFVTTRTEKTKLFNLTGNVTRYNVLSDFGRLFSDIESRVISFKLANPNDNEMKQMVVQSMQDHVSGRPGKLEFRVSQVVSSQDQVKRYIVHRIKKV